MSLSLVFHCDFIVAQNHRVCACMCVRHTKPPAPHPTNTHTHMCLAHKYTRTQGTPQCTQTPPPASAHVRHTTANPPSPISWCPPPPLSPRLKPTNLPSPISWCPPPPLTYTLLHTSPPPAHTCMPRDTILVAMMLCAIIIIISTPAQLQSTNPPHTCTPSGEGGHQQDLRRWCV